MTVNGILDVFLFVYVCGVVPMNKKMLVGAGTFSVSWLY